MKNKIVSKIKLIKRNKITFESNTVTTTNPKLYKSSRLDFSPIII